MFFCIWVLWFFNYGKENLVSMLDGLDLHHRYSDISPALFQEGFAKPHNQFSAVRVCVCTLHAADSSLFHVVWEQHEIASSSLQISRTASSQAITYDCASHLRAKCHDRTWQTKGKHTCAGMCHTLRQLWDVKQGAEIGLQKALRWHRHNTCLHNPYSFLRGENEMRCCTWYYSARVAMAIYGTDFSIASTLLLAT